MKFTIESTRDNLASYMSILNEYDYKAIGYKYEVVFGDGLREIRSKPTIDIKSIKAFIEFSKKIGEEIIIRGVWNEDIKDISTIEIYDGYRE